MTLNSKYVIFGSAVFIIGLLSIGSIAYKWVDGWGHFSGSYAYAETYELNYPVNEVIDAITKVKEENQDLIVSKLMNETYGSMDLKDGRENPSDNYHFYFYDKDYNHILFTWVRSSGQNSTTLALVSVNDVINSTDWSYVNKDFSFIRNNLIKSNFEETILKKIKAKLDSR